MQIIKLEGENFKRLKAVSIEPQQDGLVIVAGRNGQGKTSVLDLIFAVLAGPKATKDIVKPIRDGETSARGEIDLGDYLVTREWTEGKPAKLTVRTKDGIQVKSPQSLLDDLLGKWSFDPLTFLNAQEKDQRQKLLELVDLGVDLDELEAKRLSLFQDRTVVNRSVKDVAGELKGLGKPEDKVPAEPISFAEARSQLAEAERYNGERMAAAETHEAWATRANDLARQLEQAIANRDAAQAWLDQAPPPIDTAPLEQQLSDLEFINEKVRHNQRIAQIQEKHDHLVLEASKLTASIEAIDETKASALAAAKFPIEGLGVDADGVTMHGIPLVQSSGAERLRVAIALAISANPAIRVIRITDASLLDSQSLAAVEEMAKQHDVQIWLEVVDESGSVGFTIEDGEVV